MCGARSFVEVMQQPTLSELRMVAATLPGNAGAPPLDVPTVENAAVVTGDLARSVGADVVVGFSYGVSVAMEMVALGAFTGPVVILGISMSPNAEPPFFRAIIRLGSVLGTLPAAALSKVAQSFDSKARSPRSASVS